MHQVNKLQFIDIRYYPHTVNECIYPASFPVVIVNKFKTETINSPSKNQPYPQGLGPLWVRTVYDTTYKDI